MIVAVTVYHTSKLGGPSGGILLHPFWLTVGIAVGIVFGALGGWWGERPVRRWLPAGLTGGVIAGEFAALSVGGLPHPLFSSRLGVIQANVVLREDGAPGWGRSV